MRVCVLGLGYIGLPTALLLAGSHEVRGVDINKELVAELEQGRLPFEEIGLEELFESVRNRFEASTQVSEADVFLIAVPTPLEKSERVANLRHVIGAAQMVSPHLRAGNLVVLESTVPPGTCERLVIPILEKSRLTRGQFLFAHCPERAIPGRTLYEMVHNDRIIGGIDPSSCERARSLYSSFVKGSIHLTDVRTAEFVKLMENTYRDVNIALANELAQLADEIGINIWEAIELANRHPRVDILKPGPGVGGHCIAIDPWFLTAQSTRARMIALARDINDTMPCYVLQLVERMLEGITEPTLTILGVAYKGGVDDTRETPALKLIKLAENEGYTVRVHDPLVKRFEYELLGLEDAIRGSDCIVVMADHPAFRDIRPAEFWGLMRSRNVVDTRNVLDHEEWKKAGFSVRVLGRGDNH